MKINRTVIAPRFRKTLLASLLIPLFSPIYSWAAQTVNVTDGTTVSISGEYGTDGENQPAVVVQGAGSTVTGDENLSIETTARGANGVAITNGGSLNLDGSSIKTNGVIAYGINNSKGSVILNGGTITTTGQQGNGVYSTGLGSNANINGTEITTSGGSAYTVSGTAGAALTLNNTILNSSGGGSYGVYLSGLGSTLTGANNVINNTAVGGGTGIYIGSGGLNANLDNTTINMTNGYAGVSVGLGSSITMDGLTATGTIAQVFDVTGAVTVTNADIDLASGGVLRAMGNSSTNKAVIIFNNVNAVSHGGNATMVDVNMNADVTLNGGSYHSKGTYATGIWVPDTTSSVKVYNSEIITEGDGATAIDNRGTAIVDDTRVVTMGNSSHGIYSQSMFDATNMTISTAGVNSFGASAARGGQLNVDGASINTTGDSGMVLGTFASSSINAKNIIGTSSGASAYALWLQTKSIISLANSQVTTTGTNAGGIYATSSTTDYSQATLDNSQIISEQGAGIRAYGASINVDVINGSQLTGGNGLLVNASTNTGTSSPLVSNVNLNADNHSVLVGDIQADENNNVNLTLKNGSVWNGAARNAKSVDVDASSIWNLTGDADVESMKILGQLNFISAGNNPYARTPGNSFSTLTINGNLTGSGLLSFNAQLGDDSSPADKLHVTGDADGSHTVQVTNQGGLGALTTGTGINLITVDGNSNTSSFTMNGSVVAGAYEYFLYQLDEHSWNLQSNLAAVIPPTPIIPDPTDPTDPGEIISVTPVRPVPETAYRREVPGYIAAPWLNAFYGFTTLGSLHERQGDVKGAANGFNEGSWGRISGQHNKFEAGRFSYDSDIWFAQLGHDLYQAENAAGTQATAGVMVTLGKQETDAQDKARAVRADLSVDTGKIKTDAYGLGGYYTLKTQQGGYVDIVGQGTLYRNNYQSQHDAKQNGYGVAISAEVGQSYPLIGNWKIEPQGQLKYQYLNLSSFSDDVSGVSGTSYSVGQARAGMRVFSETSQQQVIKPYFSADVVHQLGQNPQVTIDTASLRPEFTKTYWQGGAGVTAKVNNNVDIYGDIKYQRAFDGKMDGYTGNLGVKIGF
ncbi:autotransporter outer membrane beta-barrel domain-containing protein [Yersinia alsatica]|uniref:Autotransporter outer membrane beta-barrel domain-containing protein n=1 Tax=Yersinia alsatica TaxID=2890317 RepID=A0ABY5URR0_9GAMM|nr:autotransporter outer membrane beta-barrel domain-containing protein [Yersinia alsatica]UWM45400.1 autotransporter outer membrane beta-barrel domain-containing protein [Yersinia alsatica]CNL48776.1 putative autotransporter protein [Yersinia frederiksenii]CNL63374.1 putative autotransporter protein [Yersinia frederiksenii]